MSAARAGAGNAHGWLVVFMCFLALAACFSARSILGLTMPLWEQELGWSRSFVSTGGALALVVMAVVAPITGNLLDRFGPRRTLIAGLIVTAAGMGLSATATQPWQFLLYFSVLSGIGFGIVAIHVVSTIVAFEFEHNRGLATGAATSGSTAGQLLLIPILALVLTAIGWRMSYAALALITLLLVPVVLLLIRPRAVAATDAGAAAPAAGLGDRLKALLRSPVFHALFWSFTLCGFTSAGVIETHLLPYAAACGFPPLPSATAYGVLSAFNLVGMVLAGWLTDRMHRPLLLAIIYACRGLSFVLLMFIVQDIALLFVFAVVFGLFDYSTVPPTASLVASHIGLNVMGLTMGILSAGHSLGAAVGAFMGGWLFDLFARYDWVWMASVGLAMVAALLVLTIRDRRTPAPAFAAA